ncbi:glycosyltransferase family 4 protein [bacterium]|jgi:glycosyltransferase involved in cell wall biosynthesis|nr:glycosyltransferase family 4 protein [bacterium]
MKNKGVLIRVATSSMALNVLLKNQLKYMSRYFDVIAVGGGKDGLMEVRKRENVSVIDVPMTRSITPFRDLISLCRLIIICFVNRPIIIHSHTPKAGLLSMIAGWITLVPIRIHTVAGLPLVETRNIKRKILLLVERITYLLSTDVYCVSTKLMKLIIRLKLISSDKISVINKGSSNGIDETYFLEDVERIMDSFGMKNGFKEDDFILTYVGRLVEDKGVNELILAFKEISRFNKSIKLLLLGSFEETLCPLSSFSIQEIKTNSGIVCTGFVDDIRPYLRMTKVFVFPTYREGFPNSLLQAALMGIPCITTNINGCNEIILNDYNGIIIPKKNMVCLLNAIEILFKNQKVYLKYKKNAEEYSNVILNDFSQRNFHDSLLKEYEHKLKSLEE